MNTRADIRGPILVGTLVLLIPMIWMAMAGQDLVDLLLDAGLSRRYLELLTTGTIALGMLGVLASFPLLMVLVQRRPAAFWAIAFIACTFSEARFPAGLDIVLLGMRYASLLCALSLGLYLAVANARSLGLVHLLGLFFFFWVMLSTLAHGGGSAVVFALAYVNMLFAVPVISRFRGADEGYRNSLLRGLCWAAPICLLINLSSFVVVPQVFLSGRFISYYPLPTNFANNFVMTAAVIWTALIWSRSLLTRMLFGALFLMACVLILLSGTRNSMICIAAMVVVSGLMAEGRAMVGVAIAVAMAGLCAWLAISMEWISPDILGRFAVSSSETRVTVWQSAMDLINKADWLGYGPDLTEVTFFDVNSDQRATMNPHNVYLGLALRFGIAGVTIFATYLAAVVASAVRIAVGVHRVASRADRQLLALAVLWVADLCIAGLFEDNLTGRGTQQQLSFGLAVGLLALSLRKEVRVR